MVSTVQIQVQDGIVIAMLPTEIDLINIRDVRAQLFDALQTSTGGLIVDLSHTTYLDSKGIHLLMELEQYLAKSRQPMELLIPSDNPVARLLDIAGVPIRRHENARAALQEMLSSP